MTAQLRAMLADIRGATPDTPPWLRQEPVERLARPRHLSERRRVELVFPALVAWRLASVLIPVGTGERDRIAQAKAVFDATSREPLDDLPKADREHILGRGVLLRAWLLDPYADQRRVGMTVLYAFTLWLDDLRQRQVLQIAEGCPFLIHWDQLADSILCHPDNVAELDLVEPDAHAMAAEWRLRLESRGYYISYQGGEILDYDDTSTVRR